MRHPRPGQGHDVAAFGAVTTRDRGWRKPGAQVALFPNPPPEVGCVRALQRRRHEGIVRKAAEECPILRGIQRHRDPPCSTSKRRGPKRASSTDRRRLAHPTASAGATAPSSANAATRCAAHSRASSRSGFTSSSAVTAWSAVPIPAISSPWIGIRGPVSSTSPTTAPSTGSASDGTLPFARWGLDWLSLVEPRGCEPLRGRLR